MAWFRNHYVCDACNGHWIAEHVEVREAHCPFCRAYDVAPYKSDDWSVVVLPADEAYVVLECAKESEKSADRPDYRPLGSFPSLKQAKAFLAAR